MTIMFKLLFSTSVNISNHILFVSFSVYLPPPSPPTPPPPDPLQSAQDR